ncbi:extracellular solute-binding protein [Corallococcus exiguus]|uniref:extracellular solute-binding protein n=1 Tax=Corallococcus TaxID=83461 RepID=UPI000EA35F12|nr:MULTISPECIES: extracellular solute-binding protein [Corallococcus]RKI46153.1 extracellular solute-binding protein [Corallococcus sp. AB004]NNC18232.1 extracellular solute-binding protein [Corallococcus exiguus]NRD55651.1 extracellular solute-binding protein [Corallococcus exiguus]NRD66019.1 extracellular solute-binding protein [Corallococcus exiguus]RKH23470.1 extracellular solute-binding protein [Corallococcus sp. CA041A]
MTHLRTLLAALCLCAVGLLPVPSFAATELVLWHAYRAEEKAALEKVVAEYNKANEGKVKVTTLAVPYDAYADKISATVPRGKGPDLFIFAQDRLGGWIEAGNTVEPIDFFLDDATKKRFIPTTMEAMTYRGTAYGLPLNYKVITLIYNKKLVPTPPKTSGEMVTMAKKLTDAKAGRFGLAYAYNDFYYHAAVMNGFGGGVFDAKNAPTMNSPANVKSVEQVLKWKNKDGILPAEPSSALITSLFNEGKAAMVFSGPWFLGEVSKDVEYGLARLPTLDENKGTPLKPWMTVEGVYVAAPSKNKEAAYDFAKFLTDAGPGKTLALEGRQSPANQAVYQDAKVAADPLLKAMKDQVDVAVPMPNLPEMSMVWTPATSAMNTVFKNTATPKAALDSAQKSVAKDVAGLRKK